MSLRDEKKYQLAAKAARPNTPHEVVEIFARSVRIQHMGYNSPGRILVRYRKVMNPHVVVAIGRRRPDPLDVVDPSRFNI